ncbi:MAG: HPF/RaiA family ribosome-associated protein [Treponema sp.]|jgi:putative sigma-54 modulation protein|nr:HPF/RaiA family ribosome-associated protein [Treponema sp.]
MNKSISAQGFTLDKDQTELINKKLERIKYAENLIVDLMIHVKEDKKFFFETTVNFRWGGNAHVTGDDFDFAAALNKMMDVLDVTVTKAKDKVQEKK